MQFAKCILIHLHFDGNQKTSFIPRRLSNADRFISKKLNLAESKHQNADESIWIEISRCTLVNMDSYRYVCMVIC